MAGRFYGGTSGLLTPIPKRDFPPTFKDKSRLTYYSTLFKSIEINSSFYKIPQASTLRKWASEVDDNFKFTFKLWQGITHNKQLIFQPADVEKFVSVIDQVEEKAGALLIQLPPATGLSGAGQLSRLLAILKDITDRWKIAVEFRNKTWYCDEIYELLEDYHSIMVIHDLPGSASPILETSLDFAYLRLHGPEGGYRGSYDDSQLYDYALYVNEWLESGKEVYTYFNNTIGDALNNLPTLKKLFVKKSPAHGRALNSSFWIK